MAEIRVGLSKLKRRVSDAIFYILWCPIILLRFLLLGTIVSMAKLKYS